MDPEEEKEDIDKMKEMYDFDETMRQTNTKYSMINSKYEKIKKALPGGGCTVLMSLSFYVFCKIISTCSDFRIAVK